MSPWFDPAPPPDVRAMAFQELLELWRAHRNDLLGLMAANEVCRRLVLG